jgi:uncharacterized protein
MARIAITGASGLIGGELRRVLPTLGHSLTPVVRRRQIASRIGGIFWDPAYGLVDQDGLEGFDAVIHLSGVSLFAPWTRSRKHEMWESRVRSTDVLARALAQLDRKPKVLLKAGAIGYYGQRPVDDPADEGAPAGDGFAAEMVEEWEAAAAPAEAAGIRVVHLRQAPVLSTEGGPLWLMLPFFRKGLGGWLGAGRTAFPWVALPELPTVFDHLLRHEELRGPVNVVAPELPTMKEFTRTVGRVLRRPVLFRVPTLPIKALPGGVGRELMLASNAAVSRKLLDSGYVFRWPDVEGALREVLGV